MLKIIYFLVMERLFSEAFKIKLNVNCEAFYIIGLCNFLAKLDLFSTTAAEEVAEQ